MIIFFEISKPFRKTIVVERHGALFRVIWLWFSIAYLNAGFNDVLREIRKEIEKEKKVFEFFDIKRIF